MKMNGYFVSATLAVVLPGIMVQLLLHWKAQTVRQQAPQETMHPADGSSVRCRGNTTKERFCHFRNICYSHSLDEFLFVHGPQSEIVSVPDGRYNPALALLTCSYDNEINFHYIDVTHEYLYDISDYEFGYKPGKYFMYSRITPGNLMHVFHDELMPLFFTFLRYNELQDAPEMRLMARDSGSSMAHPFSSLYRMFTEHALICVRELDITDLGNDLTCFEDLYVGLVGESMWHQFGFKTPEGPIPDAPVTGYYVKLFTAHLKNHLDIHPNCPAEADFGVLLLRKKNRLILNADDLAKNISELFEIPIVEMSLERDSLQDIIAKISCAKIAIGMHGAILVLSMFLPRSSLLLELFPYAINPDHRRHYRTLVELEGMDIEYVSWRNMDRSMSVPHPDNHKREGGIGYLSKEEQDEILRSTEVAHAKVSIDPEWRYYLYQDTIVDVNAVLDLLKTTNVFRYRTPF